MVHYLNQDWVAAHCFSYVLCCVSFLLGFYVILLHFMLCCLVWFAQPLFDYGHQQRETEQKSKRIG